MTDLVLRTTLGDWGFRELVKLPNTRWNSTKHHWEETIIIKDKYLLGNNRLIVLEDDLVVHIIKHSGSSSYRSDFERIKAIKAKGGPYVVVNPDTFKFDKLEKWERAKEVQKYLYV